MIMFHANLQGCKVVCLLFQENPALKILFIGDFKDNKVQEPYQLATYIHPGSQPPLKNGGSFWMMTNLSIKNGGS